MTLATSSTRSAITTTATRSTTSARPRGTMPARAPWRSRMRGWLARRLTTRPAAGRGRSAEARRGAGCGQPPARGPRPRASPARGRPPRRPTRSWPSNSRTSSPMSIASSASLAAAPTSMRRTTASTSMRATTASRPRGSPRRRGRCGGAPSPRRPVHDALHVDQVDQRVGVEPLHDGGHHRRDEGPHAVNAAPAAATGAATTDGWPDAAGASAGGSRTTWAAGVGTSTGTSRRRSTRSSSDDMTASPTSATTSRPGRRPWTSAHRAPPVAVTGPSVVPPADGRADRQVPGPVEAVRADPGTMTGWRPPGSPTRGLTPTSTPCPRGSRRSAARFARSPTPPTPRWSRRSSAGQPYFVLQGNVCALLAAKDHVNVFLYDGGSSPTRRASSPAATATRPRAPWPSARASPSTARPFSRCSGRSSPTIALGDGDG